MKSIKLAIGFLLVAALYLSVMTIIQHLPPQCTQTVGSITFSTGAPGCEK